jgi:hypothetical protein
MIGRARVGWKSRRGGEVMAKKQCKYTREECVQGLAGTQYTRAEEQGALGSTPYRLSPFPPTFPTPDDFSLGHDFGGSRRCATRQRPVWKGPPILE